MRSLLLTGLLMSLAWAAHGQTHTLSGFVREAGSQEAISSALVQGPAGTGGTLANAYGFYSLTLPAGQPLRLVFRRLGYQPLEKTLTLTADERLDVSLVPQPTELAGVSVLAGQPTVLSEESRSSVLSLPIRQLQQMPLLLGEKDVLRAFQLLPGVQKGREGTTGLYVRGGGPDQNLILLDDAVVYNASHLFGFLSVFNSDALQQATLLKGGFPARYGGRLSSVLELQMKEGNRQRWGGRVGVGLLAGRLTLEGPLGRRASVLVSGRRSYADALLRPLSGGEFPKAYFYDLNAKINYDLSARDKLYLSGYFGRDVFSFKNPDGNDGFGWGNATGTLRYNRLFSKKLFGSLLLVATRYRFGVFSDKRDEQYLYSLQYASAIDDRGLKASLDYRPTARHALRAGVELTRHRFTPSALVLRDRRADSVQVEKNPTDGLEAALYAEDTWQLPGERLVLNAGLRATGLRVQGRTYAYAEPRLALSGQLPGGLLAKVSYARMHQYVQLLSNSGLGLPTDLWVPADSSLPPQRADQWAAGLSKFVPAAGLRLSVEGFYKRMERLVGYREGASFLVLDLGPDPDRIKAIDYRQNVTVGRGQSYGLELLAQRTAGRLSGWVGYTLAWTWHQFADVNGGRAFPARYDRRHDLSVVGLYALRPRIRLTGTFVYGSGNALTVATARTDLGPHSFLPGSGFRFYPQYGATNAFRTAPYHRLDVGVQFHKPKAHGERTWEVSLYNAYNRVNAFYYSSGAASAPAPDGSQTNTLIRHGLFPILPSVSYTRDF